MKGPINPELKVGDIIVVYHMEGETSVPPGTLGVVRKITRDPFETEDEKVIDVDWENGSKLNLVTVTDRWKKVNQETIEEQTKGIDPNWKFMTENEDIFDHFDWRWLREFLNKIRKSSIVNMYAASPLLFAGRDHIDRYYGEGKEDEEEFQAVLDDAEESRHKIVQGVMSYMTANNKSFDDMNMVNRYANNFSQKILGLYIAMSNLTGSLTGIRD
jgi:hypothetical protein